MHTTQLVEFECINNDRTSRTLLLLATTRSSTSQLRLVVVLASYSITLVVCIITLAAKYPITKRTPRTRLRVVLFISSTMDHRGMHFRCSG